MTKAKRIAPKAWPLIDELLADHQYVFLVWRRDGQCGCLAEHAEFLTGGDDTGHEAWGRSPLEAINKAHKAAVKEDG